MTYIVVKLQVEGVHVWPNAFDKVSYLKSSHRHMFHICLKKKVSHNDRQIEIINLKHQMSDYLQKKYYSCTLELLDFTTNSCESIATDLLNEFNADYVQVLEDNENGAEVQL